MIGARSLFAAVFGLAACGAPAPPPPPQTPPPPPITSDTPIASAVPETPPTPPPPPPNPFHRVASFPEASQALLAGKRVYLATLHQVVGVLDGENITPRPDLATFPAFVPPPETAHLDAIMTGDGDTIWASFEYPEARSGATTLAEWTGKKWVDPHKRSTTGTYIETIVPWTKGRVIGLQTENSSAPNLERLVPIAGSPAPKIAPLPKSYGCTDPLFVADIAALPSGEFLALGYACETNGALPIVVQRFDEKGHAIGTTTVGTAAVDAKDNARIDAVTIVDVAPAPIVAWTTTAGSGDTYRRIATIARPDGDAWKVLATTEASNIMQIASDRDGGVVLRTNRRGATPDATRVVVVEIAADGTKSELELPADLSKSASTLWVNAPHDIWLSAGSESPLEIWRSKKDAPALVGTLPAVPDLPPPKRIVPAATEGCGTIVAMLFTLAKSAPATFDFPATRAAIKGHVEFNGTTFFEFERDGHRFLGARVANLPLAKKLVKLIAEKVPSATPTLVCDDPPSTRELSIDIASGRLLP